MAGISPSPRRRVARLGAALLLALATAWPAGAGAATRIQAPVAATANASAEASHIARVLRYWTPARMRSARPLDGRGRPSPGLSALRMPVASASYLPVADPTLPPFAVNGRVFVRQGGSAGYCSGTAIDTPTRQLVITAGHCVNSGPVEGRKLSFWSKYLQFVPAYSGGQAPFGAFVAKRRKTYALTPWVRRANTNYDVGAFLTHPNASAQNVADAVGGGVAVALNRSRKQLFQTFGYPGRVRRLQQCSSPYVGSDRNTYKLGGKPTMAIRCRWTPGASGGGWLIDEGTAINGLISYGLRGDRIHTFGPYFSRSNVGRLVAGL